ncbi:MAG: outer membrane lipoprotein chaperone LolA [Gammaproteobacteria bacterium]|nr:outer membrane lipoprotein chaperone LolA [Gammaproteobacteria bacterium]
MKFFRTIFAVFVLFIVITTTAQAGQGAAWLAEFFSKVKTFKAQFSQVVIDDNGNEIQNSSGIVYLARPDQFRWDYQKPYEQVIVGDGEKIWIYEPDLDQVTVKHQGAAIDNTPAQMLASDVPIEKNFLINDLGLKGEEAWVELIPKQKEATFLLIKLAFQKGGLSKMLLGDSLGNQTELIFTQVQSNAELEKNIFIFTPPDDVDVFGP